LTPFEKTVEGKGRDEEIAIFRTNTSQFFAESILELSAIKAQIKLSGLKPTLDEYDKDITEGMKNMSEKEQKVLNDTFKVPIRSFL
jgi:hypothetical protein